ncbi:hypothetical protein GCM10022243_27700 [Saccharothrix violaceirubra]|uniref:Anti-sigma-M factor RsmA n=1 Tax=Saccharothrix violaceirubra TaxID=413306 RepID=A0A7W7TA14_9PSEU|nr:hypothetical protein [Saccharothrix violaceirubra]MBB4969307.1 hypothetical protein [Saccharothrix violaceirubra]
MTGNVRHFGPPWSVDLLADFHAGVLDPATEAELRPIVDNDPEAREILAALDATLADLKDLPVIPIPAHVAGRIDAALAAEAAEAARYRAPVVDLAARRSRKKALGWGSGVLVAAAAAVGAFVLTTPGSTPTNDGVALPTTRAPMTVPGKLTDKPSDSAPLAVKGNNFGPVFGDVLKAQNYGPLENQDTLAGCLRGADVPGGDPIGVSPITLDGKSAVMAILPGGTGQPGQYRIVVLDPTTCGPDNPNGVLANSKFPS